MAFDCDQLIVDNGIDSVLHGASDDAVFDLFSIFIIS